MKPVALSPKITLEIRNLRPKLPTELFAEMIPSNTPEMMRTPQVLTFVLEAQKIDVTLLLSKKGGRIRAQSGHFGAISFVIEELISRLTDVLNKTSKSETKKLKLELGLKEKHLPFDAYFSQIDAFHEVLFSFRFLFSIFKQKMVFSYKKKESRRNRRRKSGNGKTGRAISDNPKKTFSEV